MSVLKNAPRHFELPHVDKFTENSIMLILCQIDAEIVEYSQECPELFTSLKKSFDQLKEDVQKLPLSNKLAELGKFHDVLKKGLQ